MWQTVPDLNSRGTVGRKQAGPGGRIRYEKPPLRSSEDNTNFSFSLYSGSLIHKGGGSLIHKGGISTFKDVQNEMVFKFSNLENTVNHMKDEKRHENHSKEGQEVFLSSYDLSK